MSPYANYITENFGKGVTKMHEQNELIKRTKNFRGIPESLAFQNELFSEELLGLTLMTEVDIYQIRGDTEYILKLIFTRIFNLTTAFNSNYNIFSKNSPIYEDIFNSCFFTALCMFLHNSKRTKGMSLRKFLYLNSPNNYSTPGTPNYFDYKYTARKSLKNNLILSDDIRLRKFRERLFKHTPVHYDDTEGSAIQNDSEHEWLLFFNLVSDDKLTNTIEAKTLKLIKNLYNDIYPVITSFDMDENAPKAYSKFSSKLNKLKYTDFLQLNKFILEHIQTNEKYYGINLYRFEKNLNFYNITTEVQLLLNCPNTDEEKLILKKSMIMSGVIFPKLYKYFGNQEALENTYYYTNNFHLLLDDLTISSYLVLDYFIENGNLGSDWEILFLKTINEMTENVFYTPDKIDYSITSDSQEKFKKILDERVRNLLFQVTGKFFD